MRKLAAVLLAVVCLSVNRMALPFASPSPQFADVAAFAVIGPTVRTTNEREISGTDGRIGPLWGQFIHGGGEAIPGVIDQGTIYAVYTHYDRDEKGPYDLILGKSVQPAQTAPPAMTRISIPAARYLVFPVEASSPDAIRAAWLQVYEYFAHHTEQRRAFSVDFEQHSETGPRIFIAIR
jgi:predicted transcriptional regulator YdeE